MPDFRSIISDIKNRKFAPVYILMGEEPYYIDKITEALEQSVVAEEDKEFDQTVLYGSDAGPGQLLEAATRFPMTAPLQYVALKEAQAMIHAKAQLDKMAAYVAQPNKLSVVAITYKGDKLNATSALMKAAKKNKEVVVFESPKVKEYNLPGIIRDHCFAAKISIEDRAIELLAASIGSSLGNIFTEIEKLRIVARENGDRITGDMVLENTGVSKEFNNFELVAALSRRDYYQSVNIVKHFEENPKENPTVVTCATLFTYFQRLLLAAFSADKSDKGLMATLQLKTPYALKEIRTGLQHYNASQLVGAIHAIREFDTKSKGIESFQKEYPLLLELVVRLNTL